MTTPREPLRPDQARKVIKDILKAGRPFVYPDHAKKKMARFKMDPLDCTHVVKAGVVYDPEFENGSWRYRICAGGMTVIVEFRLREPHEIVIVTMWRA